MTRDEISADLRRFFEEECGLRDIDYTQDTTLFSSNLLDSLHLLDLVAFIEKKYSISVSSMDVGVENLDTVELISNFVASRLGLSGA